MGTPLGGIGPVGVRLTVQSTEASATIARGHVVAISVAASNPAAVRIDGTMTADFKAGGGAAGTLPQIDVALLKAQRGVVDTTTVGNFFNIGIAAHDILPGKTGEVICYGPAYVIPNGAISVGEVISSAALGEVLDAASATHVNPFGVMLEAASAADATANTPRLAFVNFLPAFGNPAAGAAYAQSVKFMGKAY